VAAVGFSSAFPILDCADLPASLRFYRDLLGFAVTYRFPADGEPEFLALTLLDGSSIGLAASTSTSGNIKGLGPSRPRSGHAFELCLYADDTDEALAVLRAAGVPVLVEPADQPWGERLGYVCDPDGNRVHITSQNS
jgi:lactoylglutathione lyase